MALTTRRQVTVIAPDGMTADALGSSLCVLGKQWAETTLSRFLNVEAKIDELKETGWESWTSAGWDRIPMEFRPKEEPPAITEP